MQENQSGCQCQQGMLGSTADAYLCAEHSRIIPSRDPLCLTWLPRATMHAPVRVAMSTTAWTLHFSCAYHSASASVKRPSASVLFTCRAMMHLTA